MQRVRLDTMLEFVDGQFDGDTWEDLCDKCFRMKYGNEGYQYVPAAIGGDCGIEGYTQTGIVFQCYYPELKYNEKELYEHQRDKITRDINKLLNNGADLKKLGIQNVKEWHFVTPSYSDKKLLEHCENKRIEVLSEKSKKNLDYIDDNFKILVKVERDFIVEINRIIYLIKDYKLNLALKHTADIDWNSCPSDKVQNIKRKIGAIMPRNNDDPTWEARYTRIVNYHVSFYVKGLELLGKIKIEFPEFYEKLFELENACRFEVQEKCDMNANNAINQQLFDQILEDFGVKLKEEFGEQLTLASVMELKRDLVSSWLADCPMDFR